MPRTVSPDYSGILSTGSDWASGFKVLGGGGASHTNHYLFSADPPSQVGMLPPGAVDIGNTVASSYVRLTYSPENPPASLPYFRLSSGTAVHTDRIFLDVSGINQGGSVDVYVSWRHGNAAFKNFLVDSKETQFSATSSLPDVRVVNGGLSLSSAAFDPNPANDDSVLHPFNVGNTTRLGIFSAGTWGTYHAMPLRDAFNVASGYFGHYITGAETAFIIPPPLPSFPTNAANWETRSEYIHLRADSGLGLLADRRLTLASGNLATLGGDIPDGTAGLIKVVTNTIHVRIGTGPTDGVIADGLIVFKEWNSSGFGGTFGQGKHIADGATDYFIHGWLVNTKLPPLNLAGGGTFYDPIAGILGVANGGTGVNSWPLSNQLVFAPGSTNPLDTASDTRIISEKLQLRIATNLWMGFGSMSV